MRATRAIFAISAAALLMAGCATDAPLVLGFEEPAPVAARPAPIRLSDARVDSSIGLRDPDKPASVIRLASDFLEDAQDYWNAGAGAGTPHRVELQTLSASHQDKKLGSDFRMEIRLSDTDAGRGSRCEQTVRAFPKLDRITVEDMAAELVLDCLNRLFEAAPAPDSFIP